MNWTRFHHPDISLPVVRRRIGIEMMELLELASVFLTKGGWGLLNRACYPNQAAYRNAASRLKKRGLVVKRSEGGETPQLFLTPEGRQSLPDYFDPESRWNCTWNGIWYLLVYDVPEVDRAYRDVFRGFLKQMNMGCLQQSVWVTPQDIRPDFDDLCEVANANAFAYLFEARTVLGLSKTEIVQEAWNFDRLFDLQDLYCSVTEKNLERLQSGSCSVEQLAELMRLALEAYHGVFAEDPLLPKALHPPGYLGTQVLKLHRQLFSCLGDHV